VERGRRWSRDDQELAGAPGTDRQRGQRRSGAVSRVPLCLSFSGNLCVETLSVPAGKIPVIETYSADCGTETITTAVRSTIEIPSTGGGLPSQFFFSHDLDIMGPVGFGGPGRHHSVTSAVRLYANPGTNVTLRFHKSAAGFLLHCEAFISGFLAACGLTPCSIP
jgi:hypothetical protein